MGDDRWMDRKMGQVLNGGDRTNGGENGLGESFPLLASSFYSTTPFSFSLEEASFLR